MARIYHRMAKKTENLEEDKLNKEIEELEQELEKIKEDRNNKALEEEKQKGGFLENINIILYSVAIVAFSTVLATFIAIGIKAL